MKTLGVTFCFVMIAVLTMASLCGWCNDGKHSDCKKSIKHYDVIWYCKCEQCFTGEEEVKDEATL